MNFGEVMVKLQSQLERGLIGIEEYKSEFAHQVQMEKNRIAELAEVKYDHEHTELNCETCADRYAWSRQDN